jgi:putative nucleotidyltransferase with HDIG domain
MPPGRSVPFREEIKVAKALYEDSLNFARSFVQDVRLGRQVDYEKSTPLVEGIIDSVMRNEDALIGMKQLRAFDEYTFTHSINVAVLSTIFGKHLGLSRERLDLLGRAALFHDVGKAKIPSEVLNKPDRLTEAEFAVIKSHPIRGFEVIRALNKAPNDVLAGILEHHEKFNGQGYPGGLSGDGISIFGRIIAVADIYDALTSRRVYKEGMLANQALKVMYGLREKDFAPEFVERFIKCLGIYPVGSLVKLSGGVCAVVIGANITRPLEPVVRIVLDHQLRRIPPHTLDLADVPGEGEERQRIVEVLNHRDLNLDPAAFLA